MRTWFISRPMVLAFTVSGRSGSFSAKTVQGLIDRLVGPGHEVESGKSGLQFAGDSGPGVFLQLQKRQSGVAQSGGQPRAHLLQFLIAAPGPLGIGLEVFLHSGPPGQKVPRYSAEWRSGPQTPWPRRRGTSCRCWFSCSLTQIPPVVSEYLRVLNQPQKAGVVHRLDGQQILRSRIRLFRPHGKLIEVVFAPGVRGGPACRMPWAGR